MSEIPNHLKGLLRFCIEAGSEPSGGIEPMDPEVIFLKSFFGFMLLKL